MSTLNRARRLLLRGVAVLLLGSAFAGEPRAQTIFSDDFNRPDGTVGNGWSSWWDGAFDHSNIALVNGELVTRGFPNQAGGVFRTLPIAFPAAFAFDFRTPLTVADNQCSTLLYNEGGWLIAFNAATPAFTPLTPVQPGAAYVLSVRRFEKRRPLLRSVRR